MKKRVVIYARFSSHSQTEQSIEGQLRECYEYAKRQDLLVVAEYIDRALTGTTDKRPEFLRMIDDSKKKTFDYVLVYQLDRFARNRYDSANYKAKLKKNGVRVLSASSKRCGAIVILSVGSLTVKLVASIFTLPKRCNASSLSSAYIDS